MIQYNTKNTSFLRMHYILKEMGITNNVFFLQLYDETLVDIDPLDEANLTDEQKLRVHIEIGKNPWYFFREIVRIPATDVPAKFELTRATLAIIWSLLNDLHSYIVIPRQCYKSYTVAIFYDWLIYWGSKNFSTVFFGNNSALVTQNLARVKDIRETLPKYLNLKTNSDTDNMHGLIYKTPNFKNTIMIRAPGRDEESANNVGRGASTMGQWYDEFAFIPYNWVQYGAAIPAYSTVSKMAERNGSHHHIIITTTAGSKNTKSGAWAYKFFEDCAPFTELLYDKVIYDKDGFPIAVDKKEIKEYIQNNNNGQFFLRIEFQWYELNKPMDYLEEMRRQCGGLDEFNRGILNIWMDSNADHPLGQERVEQLSKTVIDPVRIMMIDRIYVAKFYRDPEVLKNQSHHIVFGMDCSGNTRRDYSTLVGLDVTNSEVVFTMRCNQYSVVRFARAVAYILLYLFPRSILVPERNYVGLPAIEIISENMGPSRIYKDEKDGKLGVSLVHNLRKIMYGDVLRVSIYEQGSKIHDKTIINEVSGLIVDKHGRIDHKQNGGHDDLLIAYLYTRWFIMYCKTKNKYIDAIYYNSRLDDNMSEEDLIDLAKYSSDAELTNSIYNDGGYMSKMIRRMEQRAENNAHIAMKIRNAIDSGYQDSEMYEMYDSESYINNFENNNTIASDDISVDKLADEYMNDPHEYTEDLDKDDPEKIEKETEIKKDHSEDYTSKFNHSFKWLGAKQSTIS